MADLTWDGAGAPAVLALENGAIFHGTSFGAEGQTSGEVVFNTAMSGYQEVLTDPSYRGQVVTMTYPLIGNYGINTDDAESDRPQVAALVVREYSAIPSNWRSEQPLGEYLRDHGILGIEGIDTRRLVRILREEGALRGVISTLGEADDVLVQRALESPSMVGRDLAREVTTTEPYEYASSAPDGERRFKVVVLDYGVKRNILRRLAHHGCDLTVLPATATAEEILRHRPDGVFLSNGPGDPAALEYAISEVRTLAESGTPLFGICLGHQVLALALGASTYKLKYGHRGGNHPVQNLQAGTVEITSQNHGFAVDLDTIPADMALTHVNLYDRTVEGFRHRSLPIFSVQYHPEAAPGPHDSDYLFAEFVELMQRHEAAGSAQPARGVALIEPDEPSGDRC